MDPYFDHEKLRVYQESITFAAWVGEILPKCQGSCSAKGHLDESSSGIPLNIAEGNGRRLKRDRCRFFEIAKSCALECAGCLDVLVARKLLPTQDIIPGKERLKAIVSMLFRLVERVAERVEEETPEYGLPAEEE